MRCSDPGGALKSSLGTNAGSPKVHPEFPPLLGTLTPHDDPMTVWIWKSHLTVDVDLTQGR
jgi:hypothetical protein